MKRNEPQRPNAIPDPATAGGPDTKAGAPVIVDGDKEEAKPVDQEDRALRIKCAEIGRTAQQASELYRFITGVHSDPA